jgi:hypothetical protein
MRSYQGWNINSPESKDGNWSVILEHKHSTRTHFINLKNTLTLKEVEDFNIRYNRRLSRRGI